MGNSEKQSRFREAFERGQKGDISDYKAWLQDQNFHPKRLNDEYVQQYFHEHPEAAPNHDEELEEIAEFLGFFSKRNESYHIPVIGVTGIGKTQLLHTISSLLNQLNLDLPQKLYNAESFAEEGEDGEAQFYKVIDELRDVDSAVILLDDCQRDKRIEHSLEKINETVENTFIITSWTPERWNMDKGQITDKVDVAKEIELTPLSEDNTVTALRNTIDAYSEGGVELPNELYRRIHEFSRGIPALFHTLLRRSIKETFRQKADLGAVEAVDEAGEKLGLDDVEERVNGISDKKLVILKHILLSWHPQGRRPTELVELLERDKSTVSYHLQNLVQENILTKEKSGRSTFYRVKDPVKPILQLRIAREGEFNA
jgi:DNA-binding transcriptional ArsR family regulator